MCFPPFPRRTAHGGNGSLDGDGGGGTAGGDHLSAVVATGVLRLLTQWGVDASRAAPAFTTLLLALLEADDRPSDAGHSAQPTPHRPPAVDEVWQSGLLYGQPVPLPVWGWGADARFAVCPF